jgi:hypothetical protein
MTSASDIPSNPEGRTAERDIFIGPSGYGYQELIREMPSLLIIFAVSMPSSLFRFAGDGYDAEYSIARSLPSVAGNTFIISVPIENDPFPLEDLTDTTLSPSVCMVQPVEEAGRDISAVALRLLELRSNPTFSLQEGSSSAAVAIDMARRRTRTERTADLIDCSFIGCRLILI